MNQQILDQYQIKFNKLKDGFIYPDAGDIHLKCVLSEYNDEETIGLILQDIQYALDDQFNLIQDPDWGVTVARVYYGFSFLPDKQVFVWTEGYSEQGIKYPLIDIKEIFKCWLEFLRR